ncbi:acyl-CoA dehydrogenase family protein [Chloroflexota bacterium]
MSMEAMLTTVELDLREKVREFVISVPRQLLLDMDDDKVRYPKEFLTEAGRSGLLGLRFPSEFGGANLKWMSELVALEEIGVLGTSLGCLYSLVSIVGEAINKYGSQEQKEKYLKPMIAGEIGVAEGLTEPRGGSDFFAATTSARREGDVFYLSGQKRFVVGAEGADLFLVYGKIEGIDDPKKAMTAFLVERGPGLDVSHVYGLLGTRGGGTGRITLKNMPVHIDNILGGEAGIGKGTEVFNQMMIPERMTSAGGAIGMGRAAIEIAAGYADRRRAFGKKIRQFEAVSFKIADSITLLDAARALNYSTAVAIENNSNPGKVRRLVSESKKFSTETAWEVVNHAMQVLGGIGYTNIFPVEKLLRDIRLITIWTGTNEIMNLVIQHEYYKELNKNRNLGRIVEEDAAGAEFIEEKEYNE